MKEKFKKFFGTTKGFVTGVAATTIVVIAGIAGGTALYAANNDAAEETTTIQETTTIEETTAAVAETTTTQQVIVEPQYVISGNILMSISRTTLGVFTVPDGATAVNEGVLSGIPITDFIVPITVTKIGNNLCGFGSSCPTLKAIVFYNPVPVDIGSFALNGDQIVGGCLIYVPDESIQAYKDYFHSKMFYEYELLLRPLSTY